MKSLRFRLDDLHESLCPMDDLLCLVVERPKLIHVNLEPRVQLTGEEIVERFGSDGKTGQDFPGFQVLATLADPSANGHRHIITVPGTGTPAAGICHARGVNADLPPVWMVYLVVKNLKVSLASVREGGGAVLAGPNSMGPGSAYAVIRDPAGAVAALYQVDG